MVPRQTRLVLGGSADDTSRTYDSQSRSAFIYLSGQTRNRQGNLSEATARAQVCQAPLLPTRQRYHRRSTARKLSLRARMISTYLLHTPIRTSISICARTAP